MYEFQELVWEHYHAQGRQMPWRQPGTNAYEILVSEMMLQQTQVGRVVPKYLVFIERFPTVRALAAAPLAAVLSEWSGLGYNRRAKYLHEAARQLAGQSRPWTIETLVACKGIGYNTAAAVVTYAYNQPVPFIETNVRTVFIHHFFRDADAVTDKQLLPLVEQALDREHPREWSWALMDYGTYLKAEHGNASRASSHYVRQSVFAGSNRQVRGQVLRMLKSQNHTLEELAIQIDDNRLGQVVQDLLREGLVSKKNQNLHLG